MVFQLTTRAHDSYEDTRVTLLLSKLLKEKSPDIFNAALALRRKTDVLPKIKKEKIFCKNFRSLLIIKIKKKYQFY